MRRGAVWSAVLHVLVMLAVVIGLPHFIRDIPEDTPIPVEIVTVADKTTQKERPPEPPQPPKPQVKPPEPQQAQPKPEPPKPAPIPPPPAPPPPQKAEAKPAPAPEKAPEPKAEPIPDPKAKKEPAKAPEKTAPPQRFAEAKPQKKPQPTRDDFVANLLKDVAPKKTTSETPTPKPAKTEPTPPPPQPRATAIDDQLTMSEIDFIRRQYIECWNPPAGARDARDLVVSIRVDYNPDGSVRRAAIEDTSRMSDPFFRTAAESALRAVLNPRCNPLKVPSKKYDSWKTVTLSFNPREMLGT